MIVNSNYRKIWKEGTVVFFTALSRPSPKNTREKSGWSVSAQNELVPPENKSYSYLCANLLRIMIFVDLLSDTYVT
jgi:hypothetical protein